MEIIKRRAGDYDVKAKIQGYKAIGEISTVTATGLGYRWAWFVGYRANKGDRGNWQKGYTKTLKEAKASVEHAVAHLNAVGTS